MLARRHWILLLAVFIGATAGCTTKPSSVEPDAPSTEPTVNGPTKGDSSTLPPDSTPPSKNMTYAFGGLLVDCYSIGAWHPATSSIWRPPTPPAWEATINAAAYRIGVHVKQCTHGSIGEFERSDVFLAIEYHDAIDDPDSCRDYEGRSDFAGSAMTIVTSDNSIASWLASNLDVQVYVADFNMTDLGGAAASDSIFSIEIDGMTVFSAQFNAGTANPNPIGGAWVDRYAVAGRDGGFALLDLAWESMKERQDDPIEWQIESHQPFALGTQHPSTGVMTGEIYDKTDLEVAVHKFTDSTCTEPL